MGGRMWPVAVVCAVLSACGAREKPASLDALEDRLTDPDLTVEIPFDVETSGVMGAEVSGTLLLGPNGAARLSARGSFGGEPLEALFVSDGERMWWTGQEAPVPTGTFRLVLSPDGRTPVLRGQAVAFPGGVMTVRERYSGARLGTSLPDSLFRVPGEG